MNIEDIDLNLFHYHEDMDSLLSRVNNEYKAVERENHYLHERLNSYNKEKEINELQGKITDLLTHSLVTFSHKELKNLKDFKARHWNKCAKPLNNITKGNTYLYEITETGIGAIIKVTCPICGETEDVTDVESW